jgi:hypothetical protein
MKVSSTLASFSLIVACIAAPYAQPASEDAPAAQIPDSNTNVTKHAPVRRIQTTAARQMTGFELDLKTDPDTFDAWCAKTTKENNLTLYCQCKALRVPTADQTGSTTDEPSLEDRLKELDDCPANADLPFEGFLGPHERD